ncbi:hypothetical protein HPB51_014699 [Rhipicephalus microplus]|uniref:Uncharacterized protein n=1 Tax=Rhipicephalus microplus TaxID=6941 RepID=A0A9J6DNR2_RHIMP|nr:hypothetical protein HPB51_014699 [Rhipicephalus microplus]
MGCGGRMRTPGGGWRLTQSGAREEELGAAAGRKLAERRYYGARGRRMRRSQDASGKDARSTVDRSPVARSGRWWSRALEKQRPKQRRITQLGLSPAVVFEMLTRTHVENTTWGHHVPRGRSVDIKTVPALLIGTCWTPPVDASSMDT